MRKSLIALVTLFAVTIQEPERAQAGAFATEFTQLLNHAQLVMQYLRQAEQLAEAIKQTTDMLKNSKLLPGQVFGPISNDLNALASIVQGGQALSYSLANLDPFSRPASPVTDIRAPATSSAIAIGPRLRWTRRWARYARPACRGSNSKVNSPCSRRFGQWPNLQTGEWKLSR